MTGPEVIALAGVVSGGVVGLAGIAATIYTGRTSRENVLQLARDEREHTRLLARDERLFAGRSRAYEQALRYLHNRLLFIERTHPEIGPVADPPPDPTDEERLAVEAVIGAFGSENVRLAVHDFGTLAGQFRFAANQLSALVEQGERAGAIYAGAWDRMNDLRNRTRERLREIEAMIQHELAQA